MDVQAKEDPNASKQKLSVHDWLCDLPETVQDTDLVEVQFKNTRKGYFNNSCAFINFFLVQASAE